MTYNIFIHLSYLAKNQSIPSDDNFNTGHDKRKSPRLLYFLNFAKTIFTCCTRSSSDPFNDISLPINLLLFAYGKLFGALLQIDPMYLHMEYHLHKEK